jgi:multidrug efflux pump subunit AcrA (membrane-fusion protein)
MQLTKRLSPYSKLFFLLLISALILAACSANASSTTEVPPENLDEALAEFVPAISASGIVVPVDRAVLSVAFGGVVDEILVEENDSVHKGEVLLRLSGAERLQAAVAASQLELISAEQALQDLLDNADLAAANAKETLEDAQRDYDNISTPAPQVDIDQAFANMVLLEDKLENAEDDFAEFANKNEDNLNRANAQSRLSQVQSEYDDAVRIYNAFSTPGNFTDIAIAEAELELARQNYEDKQDGPDPDALALAQARVENAMAQTASASASLEDLEMTAPFSGTIGQILLRENEWVVPGQAGIAMGDFSHFYVETTDLNEVDVANIQIDDSAIISFDSLPGLDVSAKVIQIASKSTPGEGVNYKVTLELDVNPPGLLWDMTALVEFQLNN